MTKACIFDVEFGVSDVEFGIVEFGVSDVEFKIAVDGLQIVTTSDLPPYEGPYTVDPLAKSATVLQTKGKSMADNINVNKIRQLEVSNTAGGNTLIIGEDL